VDDYQKYLDPEVLARISGLDLKARLIDVARLEDAGGRGTLQIAKFQFQNANCHFVF
jgi:hypothetical protein